MADLVPPSQIAEITRLLDAPYANTFGATETGCPPCSSSLIPVGVAPTRLSKRQSPFCEVRLVDEADVEVPDGAPGELCMRGPTLFSGYWRAPEVNARDFRGGWFHMGDVFIRNPDGTPDFVDRVKYLIKSGGENIYPAEVEDVLYRHPDIVEAAVVGVPHEVFGEEVVAFVVKGGNNELTEDDVIEYVCQEITRFKAPSQVHFIKHLPKSRVGKILRRELRDQLAGKSSE